MAWNFVLQHRSVRWVLVNLSLEDQEQSRLIVRNESLIHYVIV